MPKRLRVRTLKAEERAMIKELAHSRTAPARQVERARMVWDSHEGMRVDEIAKRLDVHAKTVRLWLKRFDAQGLEGLQDHNRSGRPAHYGSEVVGEVIATALSDPQKLDLPFASWTLDRLAAYLHEHKQRSMKRSRIGEILLDEGLRWRQQESWFGEQVDPEFAEKRGASSGSTPSRRQTA